MDLQNGDSEERRVIRKTTVLSPINLLVQPNFQSITTKRYSKKKTIPLPSENLVTGEPRRRKNTIKTKCLELTSSNPSRGFSWNVTKKNKTIDHKRSTNKMPTNSNAVANDKSESSKTRADIVLMVNQIVTEPIGRTGDIPTACGEIETKSTENSVKQMTHSTTLQNMETKIDTATNSANNLASKKSAQTVRYMKRQRYIRKQELKNELLTKERMKERRKQCLENLQIISKKLLQNNIENKSKKNLIQSSARSGEIMESVEISNPMDKPKYSTHASLAEHIDSPSDTVSLCNRETIDTVINSADTVLSDQNTPASEGDQTRENINSNKKRIKLDKNSIHNTDSPSSSTHHHSEKKKKTELNTSDVYLSIAYPYNLITTVENKLSMTLKSSNNLMNEPYLANTGTSTSLSSIRDINESKKIENHFLNEIGSLCGIPNIHDMCNSSNTQILNYSLTERYKKNKSWSKSFDNKKNSFFGVKKVIKNKPQSNKNYFNQFQSSFTNLNNINLTLSLEDIRLDSENNSLSTVEDTDQDYMKNICNEIYNAGVAKENRKSDLFDRSEENQSSHIVSPEILPSSEFNNCSGNSLNAPNLNLVFTKRCNDNMTKMMYKNNTFGNQINSSFKNELSLLNSFNESLRHIQMVEDTLTSIRKTEDSPGAAKVLNLSSDVSIITKSKVQKGTNITMENERSTFDVTKSSPVNPVLTNFNVLSDKYTSYSPAARNNFLKGIRSEQNSISYSEDEKNGTKIVTSQMSIQTTTFKKDNEISIAVASDTTPQRMHIDSCEFKQSSISQLDNTTGCNLPNKMLFTKKTHDHEKQDSVRDVIDEESTDNSLACDSNIETGIEHLLHDTSSSFKSILNSKNTNPHMLNHLNRFCVFMMSQYMEDEKVRSEYLDMFLKVREKTLMDATRSEILFLEIQKKHFQEQVPYLKKKQRGLLVKLQQERNEIRNIKKFQHERSNERKETLKRQLKYFKTIFSSNSSCKEKKKSPNKSNILVHTKSIARNSPVKAFSLSLSADTDSHDNSLSQINEIIQKKKFALAKQKKKMNDLLLSHYELQMDAAEIKAIGDRIKDSKGSQLREFSDLRDSINRTHQENKSSIIPQTNNVIKVEENRESEIVSHEVIPKHSSVVSPISKPPESENIISNDSTTGIINIPNNFGIIPLNVSKISILPKNTDSIEKKIFNNEYNLEASSISLNIRSIPKSIELADRDSCYGLVNGSNLNMLWRKITGEKVDKYNNSNYYEMSEEKLDIFFEGAKHVALQNLLRLKTFEAVKSEMKTVSTSMVSPNDTVDVKLVDSTEQAIDTILKPTSNFNNAVHYSLKNDLAFPSHSDSKKSLSKFHNIYNNKCAIEIITEKNNPEEFLSNAQYEHNATSASAKLTTDNFTNKVLNKHSDISKYNDGPNLAYPIGSVKENSDQSDSSESTARSLIEELTQFDSLVHMNSSYTEECEKSTLLPTPRSVLISAKDETLIPSLQKTRDNILMQHVERNTIVSFEKESITNLSMTQKLSNENDLDASKDTNNLSITKLNHSYTINNELEITNEHYANMDNEATSVINLNEDDIANQEVRSDLDSKLDSHLPLNVIEWQDSQQIDNKSLMQVQPGHIEEYKSNAALVHTPSEEDDSFQNDFRMLNQLVNNSSHLQDMMNNQNANIKKETSPPCDSSQNEACSDVSIDKTCNDLLKTDDNNDGKNNRHHDLISNTWDLMSSSPEPSPRDSPTGEYSPATAAFSVSLSRIDEELRKKQLAIELEIKALEQQQTQLPYCLVREIPDKPPPPYIPPIEDTKLPIVSSPKDATVVAKPIIHVSTAIKSTCSWLWSQYSGENTKNINYANFDNDVNLSKDNHYSIFLFDLCRETFEKEIVKRKSPSFVWEYKKVKLLKPEKLNVCLVVENKVKKFLGLEIWPVKKNLITNWAQKRQDYINELLLKELYKEEIDWANIEEVESEVKNNITDTILESLLLEVCKEFNEVF